MKLSTFKTLWGNQLSIYEACEQARLAQFDGIEGRAPSKQKERLLWLDAMSDNHCQYVAEVVTGGDYVPNRQWSMQQHLDDLAWQLDNSLPLNPLFATAITGCDAWSESTNIEFFSKAMDLAKERNIILSFETHRSRSLFTPWITLRMVEVLPDIKLTVDISHWCVVCERLMDSEIETMQAIANNVFHIHGRVGYDQGPQVPDPAAAEYSEALASHERIWQLFWTHQINQGREITTMTPEFGPDGYCHLQPYTQQPVVDIWKVNCWMNHSQRSHFDAFMGATL
ncbi:hypothetical protein JCM30760_17470 [Thiomicrorhabdus hydrogeniphila]